MENFDAFQSRPSVEDEYAVPAPGHPRFYQPPAHAQHPGVLYGAVHGPGHRVSFNQMATGQNFLTGTGYPPGAASAPVTMPSQTGTYPPPPQTMMHGIDGSQSMAMQNNQQRGHKRGWSDASLDSTPSAMGGGGSPLFSMPSNVYPSPQQVGGNGYMFDPQLQIGSGFPSPGDATTYVQQNRPEHEYDRIYPASQIQTRGSSEISQSATSYQQGWSNSIPATRFVPPSPGAYAGVPYPAAAPLPPSEAFLQYQQQRRRDAQQGTRASMPRGQFAVPRAPYATPAMRQRGRRYQTPGQPSGVGGDSVKADGEAEHPSKRARYDGGPAPMEQELNKVLPQDDFAWMSVVTDAIVAEAAAASQNDQTLSSADRSMAPPPQFASGPSGAMVTHASYDAGAATFANAAVLPGAGESLVADQPGGTHSTSCCSSHAAGTPHEHGQPSQSATNEDSDSEDWTDSDDSSDESDTSDDDDSDDSDDDSDEDDNGPIAESSTDAVKRALTSRARRNTINIPVGRGRKAAIARRSASGNKPKSSGPRIQKHNKLTTTKRLPMLRHLAPIVNGKTPCPFCQKGIRTVPKKDSKTGVPGVTCCRDHFVGYKKDRKKQCRKLKRWGLKRVDVQDPAALAKVGRKIVRRWPTEVAGKKKTGWFRYRMWGTKFRKQLLDWWSSLEQEERDKILERKKKGEDAANDEQGRGRAWECGHGGRCWMVGCRGQAGGVGRRTAASSQSTVCNRLVSPLYRALRERDVQ
ncbi:hypothetical protein EXIGLDRAFT_745949 [Exidia glandulosa HHB12029]|uniref:Uncharacterized protein n=1 Tax=Exidia glandulosa HHB12029 TaxID=1314781 RepID=A0A165MW89_EXIGL|nr:hypothetical protein EXIGLDRAFT_745949 [Exidia glandulosa HHB12029]